MVIGMDIVIDEWIVHYIEEEDNYLIAFEILSRIYDKCDNLMTLENGPLISKIHTLMKELSRWNDPKQISIAKFFISNFVLNSKKFKRLDQDEIHELSDEEKENISDASDTFLFEALYTSEDGIILTTDERLKNETSLPARIELVRDFIEQYNL